MKEFDPEELSRFDGRKRKPVYIAHEGKVIDVSKSKLWGTGIHMKRHSGGRDLTGDIQAAPHGPEVLERYPQIGILKKELQEREIPKALSWLLHRIPMLRRHPHPMTVHFPIVFTFATAIFNVLYVITRVKAFEITALHCLGAGILFTPVAIFTGLYTWWLNYEARPMRAVAVKRAVSVALFVIEIILFVWRIKVPGILDSFHAVSVIYFLLILSLFALVTIIGWYGASLTFPVEKEGR